MFEELASVASDDLGHARERVQRHAADIGTGFRIIGEADERPWPVSPVPLLIEADEWAGYRARRGAARGPAGDDPRGSLWPRALRRARADPGGAGRGQSLFPAADGRAGPAGRTPPAIRRGRSGARADGRLVRAGRSPARAGGGGLCAGEPAGARTDARRDCRTGSTSSATPPSSRRSAKGWRRCAGAAIRGSGC